MPVPSRLLAAPPAAVLLLALATDLPAQPPAGKRPVRHSDYDIWNTAAGLKLSPDGQHVAYVLTPGDGDGAVVVRNVATGAEHRLPTGGRSPAAPGEPAEPGAEPAAGGPGPAGGPEFSPDSRRVVFPLAPTKADLDKARADNKKPGDLPRPVLAVFDLQAGQVVARVDKVRSFRVVGDGAGYLILHKDPRPEDLPKAGAAETPGQAPPPGFGGRRGLPGGPRPTPQRPAVGAELVVRNLAGGGETTFADVAEFSVTRDAKQLVVCVQSKAGDRNGVYVAPVGGPGPGSPVKAGPGRYFRLTWDDGQTKLAFFQADPGQPPTPPPPAEPPPGEASGRPTPGQPAPPPPLPPAKVRVFVWDRPANPPVAATPPILGVLSAVAVAPPAVAPAREVLGPTPAGLKDGWAVVDRGGLGFSADGLKLSVGTAPVPVADPGPTSPAGAVAGPAGRFGLVPRGGDDRVDLDIWHWKDPLPQPMQKVRAAADRAKTYRAVVLLDTGEFRQLADEETDVAVPGRGDWGLGSSDNRFRGQQWVSPPPRDYSLVNVRTGEVKPAFRGQDSPVYRSPDGRALVAFDGKDWHGMAVPDGTPVNLTAKLPAAFFNEDQDTPETRRPYGMGGFTADGRHALLFDRYDVWKVAADGTGAENLTKVGRETKTRLRPVRLPDPDDAPDTGVALSKPLLLAAENLDTRDTGFLRLDPGGRPRTLVMGARRYGLPTKARRADIYLFTVQTFADHPDYYAADPDFREVKRVTDINPRVREFNWGTAELVAYKSADGVPLQGVLIKPEDFDPAKKYPMVVYIYERLSQNLHGFVLPRAGTSINPTYYASNGYLVFMPDIAYTVGSPGQSALKCVLPAIQAVADKGFVKEDAVGVQGHSWGGYQIAYMVTQTNRFRAAAAGAPVSNMTSAYGGVRWESGLPRQFQYEHSQSRIGRTLWDAPMRYIENSPVFLADRVRTPLLMLHNDADGAVPWYQGIEYYLALRRLGKEVYLLNYNGEAHGLRRKATQRDYTLRMQQFFDHHLKGAPMPEWMAAGVPYLDRDKEKDRWKKAFGPAGK